MNAPAKVRMKVPEFLEWAEAQPKGRYELVNGEVVAMAPERARHNLAKGAAYRALVDAVEDAGLPCSVFSDGMTVTIDEDNSREPDVSLQCGVDQDLDSVSLVSPMIVIEVISPSSKHSDTSEKLVEYFSIKSIQHYLIIDPEKKTVIHHRRNDDSEIRTHIFSDGELKLSPPGITIPVNKFFDRT